MTHTVDQVFDQKWKYSPQVNDDPGKQHLSTGADISSLMRWFKPSTWKLFPDENVKIKQGFCG